jgi:hypothetical protein
MSKKTKAFIFQLISFSVFFIISRIIVEKYTGITGFWIPFTAAVVSTILAPKFQVVKTNEGEKLFMQWMFIKGVKEIK